ncbi:hypothetical protein GCK32_000215 [Trichostrongylus colubriformis]|uniref:Phlebovirus glycoprotein G2 fusion domain-containing protein n=1 Tax=Trichostrongylus colubriformis TaxID=6319 RepID=A0AAN8IFD5_TRICO
MGHTVQLARTVWKERVRMAFRRRLLHRRQHDVEAFLNTPLITLTFLAIMASTVYACQEVDIFSQPTTICHVSPQGQKRCLTETTEILKMNSFHQEACLRLLYNQTSVKEVRIMWKRMLLTCEKETLTFTRASEQGVMDSKRYKTMGSYIFENRLENRFPICRPWITLTHTVSHPRTNEATIPMFTTAEVLIHFKDKYDMTVTESTPVETQKKQKKSAGLKEEPRKGRFSPKASTSSNVSSTFDPWEEFCRRGATIFQETSKQIEAVKKNDAASLASRDSQLSTIAQRTETLGKVMTDHHEFVKHNLMPATLVGDEQTVQKIMSHISKEITKGTDQIYDSVEEAKNATDVRVDEVELKTRNVRSDVQNVSYESMVREFYVFQTEVKRRLDELGTRQLEILSFLRECRKQESTPHCAATEGVETPDKNGPPLEERRRSDSKTDDARLREAIRENHKELNRVKHEIFSLIHRMKEAQKV